jgi:hypothetical protein
MCSARVRVRRFLMREAIEQKMHEWIVPMINGYFYAGSLTLSVSRAAGCQPPVRPAVRRSPPWIACS